MIIDYQPRGVCSRRMTLEVEEGVIRSIRIQGGCDGNLQGISRLGSLTTASINPSENLMISRVSTAFTAAPAPLPARISWPRR